jgi:iron complex outermembrane receptor protein
MRIRVLVLLLLFSVPLWAADSDPLPDLKSLSLEELMHLDVTSVRKKEERLDRSAAAIYVITRDQIRRSGLTSIPELLRLAPGVQVARINGNAWAISVRGFNGAYSEKLLVMIDGRTVYNPLFSGVFWDAQNTLIEDIDRIEVVRGPVSPLWGANAVNGAINVITRGAEETQGGLLSVGSGTEDRGHEGVRYGGAVGSNTFYRVYGQSDARPQWAPTASGLSAGTWGSVQGGFRVDTRISTLEDLTVQGDMYRELGDLFTETVLRQPPSVAIASAPLRSSGGNLLARWTRRYKSGGQTVVQTYYDHLDRGNPRDLGIDIQTADLDVQHWFPVRAKQEWMIGGGYRQMWDRSISEPFEQLTPSSLRYGVAYLSLLDRIALVSDRVVATLGARGERSVLSGYSLQPTARIAWTVTPRHNLWAAWTRAERTPSRGELGFVSDVAFVPTQPLPVVVSASGNPSMRPETSNALDAGYRVELPHISVDLSGFHYQYQGLRSLGLGAPQVQLAQQPFLLLPGVIGNGNVGYSRGAEAAAVVELPGHSRLSASYSALFTAVRLRNPTVGAIQGLSVSELASPQNQWQASWQVDLPHRVQMDFWGARVGALMASSIGQNGVPAYTRLDVHLSRRILEAGEVQIGGQNLLDALHQEFLGEARTTQAEIRRAFYARFTWRF